MNRHGFTLVEVIIATFLFAIIAGGVAVFSVYYFQNYSFSFEENQSIGDAQVALTRMIREIREVRLADNGAWPLEQTDDNLFIFFGDVTGDGRSDRVRYFISGTDLKRGIIQPTAVPVTYPIANESLTTVAANVDLGGQPLFRYYNGNWPSDTVNNPLTAANRILNARYVTVYIRLNIKPNTGAQPYELTSGVQMRSLKDNL